MTSTLLKGDVPIERHARLDLIREVFARSPLFREATVSGPVLTRDGELGLDVSFDGGPTLFRVVAGSEDRAYAILYDLALAMVEVDQWHRRVPEPGTQDEPGPPTYAWSVPSARYEARGFLTEGHACRHI